VPAVNSSKYMVQAGWDDVAHLDQKTTEEMLENTPVHLRDARSKGTPSLGAGAIYPIAQSEFTVAPFAIPSHWWKAYGLDVGWKKTAAPFGAWDRDADVLYIYAEHYRGMAEPSVHADAIKARGEWLQGTIDPASRGRNQKDGEALLDAYTELGLSLIMADNTVEAGLVEVFQMLSTGRLKVFTSCVNWLSEHRLYRRDEKGAIIKAHDHLMDATRYLVRMRHKVFSMPPAKKRNTSGGFQIANSRGGY